MILRNLRILFIDDEADYVGPIADYLTRTYQHVTTSVPTVERAQREIAQQPFDIIFLDYRLPGASGIDFLKWASEQKLETPIIMVTGHGREELAVEAMKMGAYDYLNKTDINLDHLPIAINNAYERFVLRKAREELDDEKLVRDRNMLAIKIFQDTVRSFINRINNDLATILLRVKMFENDRTIKKSPEAREKDTDRLLKEIAFSGKAIEASVSALVQLNQSVTKLHDVEKKAVDLQKELEKTLREMQKKGKG